MSVLPESVVRLMAGEKHRWEGRLMKKTHNGFIRLSKCTVCILLYI